MTRDDLFMDWNDIDISDEVDIDCGDDEKKKEEIKLKSVICGAAVFKVFPVRSQKSFDFVLCDGSMEYRFTVREDYDGSSIAMVEGRWYMVTFLEEDGKNIACDVCELEKETGDEAFVEHDFIDKCVARGGSRVVLVRDIEGKYIGVDKAGEQMEFSVLCGRKLCHCVYEKKMNHGAELSLPHKGEQMKLRLYSVCGKNYVRTDITEDVRREIITKAKYKRDIENESLPSDRKEKYLRLLEERKAQPIVEDDSRDCEVTDYQALVKKYELLRCIYPPDVQVAINNVIKCTNIKTVHRAEVLKLLVNTEWNKELDIKDDAEYLRRELDKRFCGQERYKQEIIKMISAFKHRKDKKGGALLIVGVPGIGKTSMFRYAAEVAGIPFEKISLNSISNGEYLSGTPRLYSNAVAGKIMTTVGKTGNRAIILLDEVDKMEKENENDPKSALYDILDGNEKYRDNFIDEEIDLSDIQFVLTANDTSSIPAPILDRVTVIRIDDYTDEEKIKIARDYVLPRELAKYDLDGKTMEWEEDVFTELATRYTMSSGVRDIESNIENTVRTAVWKLHSENIRSIKIRTENLPEFLGLMPCRRDKVEYSYSALHRKFSWFKPEYDPQVRTAVQSLFTEYEQATDPSSREYIRKSLFCLVNILPAEKKSYDLVRIREKLDETHYGMETLKDEIITVLAAEESRNSSAPRCILLDGPSGVGKSSVCESIAAASGRKFIKISLNGVSNAIFIKGSERQYHGSACGTVAAELAKKGTDGVLILLDEVDKMTVTQNGDPYAALIDLLDDSGYFTDSFLNVPMNISNVLFIATSNDASRIPPVLRNRMSVVSVPSYSTKEKLHIAKNYILPKKLREYGVQSDDSGIGEIMDTVVYEYCKGFGLRDIARATDRLVRENVRKKALGEDISCENTESLARILGAKPHERGNVASEERYRAGIARALAVSGNAGTTFAVQVTENRFSKEDEITGLPKASTLDSIKIAKLLVSNMLGRHLPTLHFHFGEGGIEKDGPSAGITIFSALYSCMTGIKVPRDIGFTGELDVFGDVWAIGGVEQKLHAAESAGCSRVFIPVQNYESLLEEGALSRFGCEIIPIANISELCDKLFGGRVAKEK